MKLYQAIATALEARRGLEDAENHTAGNREWFERWTARLDDMAANWLPSGSGFDCGTKIDVDAKAGRIVLDTEYHHLGEHGMYTRWTAHSIIVTPNLAHGFDLRVTGVNHNDIKSYIGELFHSVLDGAFDPVTEWRADD